MNTAVLRETRFFLRVVSVVVALGPVGLSARDIFEAGQTTVWRFFDSGVEPAADWNLPGFDDATWKSGAAPLGFGETRLTTQVGSGPDELHRPLTTKFRHAFAGPKLKAGESLVVVCSIDDGVIVYLNGREIGRLNMPAGPIRADTAAMKTIGNDEEGFYHRLAVPAGAWREGETNVLAADVHQATAMSSDLFFDLALKVLPAVEPEVKAAPAARTVVNDYNRHHYVGPGVAIPDGYIDGGRGMKVDAEGSAASGREILRVDRSSDVELAADLAFARSAELRELPTLERMQQLAERIDCRTTPPGGSRWVGPTTEQLEAEFTNKPVLIGDWIDQCQAGVCRHRALLFKLPADEAGLRAALVRGNFASDGPPGAAHAWNEVEFDDGRRVLVDVMHNGGAPKFPPLTDADVIRRYLKVDGTPWYAAADD